MQNLYETKFSLIKNTIYSSKELGWTGIILNFKKTVKVTKYQKAYGLFDLVVEVGSSLGLWIGLSALGVFDLLLQCGTIIKQKLKHI